MSVNKADILGLGLLLSGGYQYCLPGPEGYVDDPRALRRPLERPRRPKTAKVIKNRKKNKEARKARKR